MPTKIIVGHEEIATWMTIHNTFDASPDPSGNLLDKAGKIFPVRSGVLMHLGSYARDEQGGDAWFCSVEFQNTKGKLEAVEAGKKNKWLAEDLLGMNLYPEAFAAAPPVKAGNEKYLYPLDPPTNPHRVAALDWAKSDPLPNDRLPYLRWKRMHRNFEPSAFITFWKAIEHPYEVRVLAPPWPELLAESQSVGALNPGDDGYSPADDPHNRYEFKFSEEASLRVRVYPKVGSPVDYGSGEFAHLVIRWREGSPTHGGHHDPMWETP